MQQTKPVVARAHQKGKNLDNYDTGNDFGLGQLGTRQELGRRRIARRSTIFSKLAVVVALYFIATVMLAYICTRFRSNLIKPGLQQRVLAAGGGDLSEERLQAIIAECLAMAEEPETVSTPVAQSAEVSDEPDMMKASLEQYPLAGGSASVPTQSFQQQAAQLSTFFEAPVPYHQIATIVDANSWGEAEDDPSILALLSPDAWLEQIPSILQEQPVQVPVGEPKEAGSASTRLAAELPDSSAAVQATAGPEEPGLLRATQNGKRSSLRPSEEPAAITEFGDLTSEDAASIPAATPSIKLAEVPQQQQYDPGLHPYVRLPVVDPSVIQRDFDPDAPLHPIYSSFYFSRPLQTIRAALLKDSLSVVDVEHLLFAGEALVYIWRNTGHISPFYRPPNKVLHQVSLAFLTLDALVSLRYVLGERMHFQDWWPEFMKLFHTDFSFAVKGRHVGKMAADNIQKEISRRSEEAASGVRWRQHLAPSDDPGFFCLKRIRVAHIPPSL
ncbi:hypothetical protein Efla_004510 [Eimeria flavescens]